MFFPNPSLWLGRHIQLYMLGLGADLIEILKSLSGQGRIKQMRTLSKASCVSNYRELLKEARCPGKDSKVSIN